MRNGQAVSVLAFGALVGFLALTGSVSAEKHGPPPQPLHQEADGHWTPYEAPKEIAAGPDIQVYTIAPGDWLSKIAQKSLGDWKLWPQIWEKNLWMKDSHWIYPGDKIVIAGGKAEGSESTSTGREKGGASRDVEGRAAGVGEGREGAEGELESASLAGEPTLLGTEDDIYCFGYLDDSAESFPHKIMWSEDQGFKIDYAQGEIMFIDAGSADGVKAGDEFFVIRPATEVFHPDTDSSLGWFLSYMGRVRILCAQEQTSTIEIVLSCDGVRVGDSLKPFQPVPIPIARKTPPRTVCDPASGKARGEIVYVKDELVSFGQGHVVAINLGSEDGIKAGDFLTVFSVSPDDRLPRSVFGEVGVLTVEKHTATAKVLESRQNLWRGLSVEVK